MNQLFNEKKCNEIIEKTIEIIEKAKKQISDTLNTIDNINKVIGNDKIRIRKRTNEIKTEIKEEITNGLESGDVEYIAITLIRLSALIKELNDIVILVSSLSNAEM